MRELYGRSGFAFQRRIAPWLSGSVTLALLFWPASPAAGQDQADSDPLGEVALFQELPTVTAASKFEQDSREAPASISIISREEIERFGYRTLGEALNAARGIFTSYDRNYTYIAVRGFTVPGDYNTRILLLVDGHRLNDNVADAAYVGTESALDMSVVDRIEIIRGAASSLYGTNAFYGVINVITRNGRSLQGGEVQADAGTFDSYRARAVFGERAPSGVEYMVGGGMYRSSGDDLYFPEFDAPETSNGVASGLDGDRAGSAFAKISYQGWSLQAGLQDRKKEVPTASYGTNFDDPRLMTQDQHAFAVARYAHPFADLSRFDVSLAFDRHRYQGTYPYEDVVQQDLQSGDWTTLEAQYVRPLGRKHKVVVGGEYRLNTRQDQALYDVDPFQSYLDDQRSSSVWAVFVQDEYRITNRLLLNAGLRHDSYETFGGTTNPRAALIYTLDQRTTLKALYGQAFRAPNLYELYSQDGGISQKPSLTLQPETIQSYELVAERQLARSFRGTLSLYHFDVDRLIGLTTDPEDGLLMFANLNRFRSQGVELGAEGSTGPFSARASYAYQHVRDVGSDIVPVNSPSHVGRLGVSVAMLGEKARLGTEFRWLSSRRTVAGGEVPAYGLVNLTLLARPGIGGLVFSGSVYNLLNREYADPGGEELAQEMVVQDGRVVRLGVRYLF
jgi:iron complex outermembrane receptor protein